MNTFTTPKLIENKIKTFYIETLKNCHKIKEKYYNLLFNILAFIFFIFIVSIILICKYKGKITEKEKNKKEEDKKHYILSKIKNYQETKLKEQQQLITGLPYIDTYVEKIL